jgi:pilus assembly protein Flp/PilA
MRTFIKKLIRNEQAATAIEYGLIAALLSIGIIAAVGSVKNSLNNTFNKVNTGLTNANKQSI